MIIRELDRVEIELIWEIDRRETIEAVYHLQDGELVLEARTWNFEGWPPDDVEVYTSIFFDCFDREGTFYGAFEDNKMVGIVILESKFIGRNQDRLQLLFMAVGQDQRRGGLGRTLFEIAVEKARTLGARKLYISAIPSRNAIDFYRYLGCVLTDEIDPDLYALEPDDIHMEYVIP